MGLQNTGNFHDLWPTIPEPLRSELRQARRDPACLSKLARLANQHPEQRGRILCMIAMNVAVIKQNRHTAMHVLRMARRDLVDDYEWIIYAAWLEVGIALATPRRPAC
jgi:hypothetical protein